MARKKMKAIDYIRKGWCKFVCSKDKFGFSVEPHSERASSWCSVGAISAAYAGHEFTAKEKLRKVIKCDSIANWNDAPGRTKRQVLAAFRKAGI